MARKDDLIKTLIEDYGYDEVDLLDENGKKLTNAKLEAMIKQEENDALELNESEKKKKKESKVRKIERHEAIQVMNGCFGGLLLGSPRTGQTWKFTAFGQVDTIEFADLETIKNRSKVIQNGQLIILDDDVVKKFKLEEQYKNILTPDNIEQIYRKPVEEIEKILENLPKGMHQTFTGKAIDMYLEGRLNNFNLIKFIEEKFKISFDEIM